VPDVDRVFRQWHDVYVESKKTEFELNLARSLVAQQFALLDADYFKTSVGTIALQHRKPTVETDWETLARALIPAKTLAKHVGKYTTTTPNAPVLQAPRDWSAEAGVRGD
jgi:hypothetical protein